MEGREPAEPPRTAVIPNLIPLHPQDVWHEAFSSAVPFAVASDPSSSSSATAPGSDPATSGEDDGAVELSELQPGQTFLGFELVEELGQGALARVFLGRQQALAGRLVVVKVTRRWTREPERLARLQHTHIVPVYSVHHAPPVQLICMPYLGRCTLADVLRVYRQQRGARPSTFRSPTGTTRQVDRSDPATAPPAVPATVPAASEAAPSPPPDAAAVAAQYIRQPLAVLRLIRQLADGLRHAHGRGILHLDLKPGNVLLADSGELMLFDFNLAWDAREQERELVGGTVPYMAIEQLEDLRRRGAAPIDQRTDLYALGVIAWELLTGEVPFPAAPPGLTDIDEQIAVRRSPLPSLQQRNPAVTPAVEAIVRKLLAPEPQDRYQSAAELLEDIDRHLADLPLRHVPEPSLRERFQKWRRRNPRLLRRAAIGAAAALVLLAAAGTAYYLERQARAAAWNKYQQLLLDAQSVQLDILIHDDDNWQDRAGDRVYELLARYGIPHEPEWLQRPDVQRLPTEHQRHLADTFGDLLVLLVQCRWSVDRWRPEPEQEAAAAELLGHLQLARQLYAADATPPLFHRLWNDLVRTLGRAEPLATPLRPATAYRERFLEAAALFLEGKYEAAAAAWEQLSAEQPTDGVTHFGIGCCRQQLGQNEGALDRFSTAAALLPHDERPLFHRGQVLRLTFRRAAAERDYTQAIAMNLAEPAYYRARGLTLYQLRKHDEALADLDQALQLGGPDVRTYLYRSWVRRALGQSQQAAEDLHTAMTLTPRRSAECVARGVERMKSDPAAALADFELAVRLNPRNTIALYNLALVHLQLRHHEQGLAACQRVLQQAPDYALGWVLQARFLAEMGHRTQAHEAARKSMQLASTNYNYNILVWAAGVFAITARTEPRDAEIAIQTLEKAFQNGFRLPHMLESPVYAALRDHPRYRQIMQSARMLFDNSKPRPTPQVKR